MRKIQKKNLKITEIFLQIIINGGKKLNTNFKNDGENCSINSKK